MSNNAAAKNRIGLVVPYFGKLPNFFNIFLKGASYNTHLFDVLIFTDIDVPRGNLPSNIKIIPMSFAEMAPLAEKKMGFKVELSHVRKLCDFKPTYGKVFEDYLKDYEFWGYGDIDMVYGNISKFITPALLEKYDVFSLRDDWMSGAFAFYKNTEYLKSLYTESRDYKMVYTNPKHLYFDECGNKYTELRARIPLEEITSDPLACWTTVIHNAEKAGTIKPYQRTVVKEAIAYEEILVFDKGELTMAGWGLFAFYHMVYNKTLPYFKIPNWQVVPDRFYITPTGFYTEADFANKLYPIKKIERKWASSLRKFYQRVVNKLSS